MAKASWMKFVKTKEQMGLTRVKAAGKSPQTKMLEAIDKQISNITDGTLGPKAAWYQGVEGGYRVNVRYGTTSLDLTGDGPFYVETNDLKPFLMGFREEVLKGSFNAKLEEISTRMSASKKKKA